MKTINKIIIAFLLMASFVSCSNEQEQKVIATEEIIREDSSLAILAKMNDGVELGFLVQQDAPNQVILVHCERDKIPTSGHVTIPNQFKSKGVTYTVTGIKSYVFSNCESLTSVTIPNSVTSIGEGAFMDCTNITSITIPNSVTSIDALAFDGCTNLIEIVVSDGNRKYDSRDNCNAIIETASNTLVKACRNTTIPNTVTSIGRSAFANCEGLTCVTIPSNVTNIDDFAFFACPDLTKIVVADGNRVFDSRNNCNAIIETASNTLIAACCNTTIPDNVTNIGMGAFCGCTGLTSATILNPDLQSQYDYVFIGCDNLPSGEYVWIVGTWACDMGPYGTVVVKFDGDGSSGTCTEAQYGSYKTGTYNVSGNTLRYKLFGESGTTTIEIEPGHKLSAGGGYYYHKRDNDDAQYYENDAGNVANGLTKEYEWILGEWKGVDFKGDLAIITRDGIVCNNAVRSGMLDEVEPNRSELTKQTYEIKKTKHDFDNKEYMSIVVNGDSAYFRDGEAAYFLDLKSKVIFYFYDFDQKIVLKKVN